MTQLDALFFALSDPTRRQILARLTRSSATTGELSALNDLTLTGTMKHLKVLEAAGLLQRQKSGRTVTCTLHPAPLRAARDWIDEQAGFWELQLDSLASHLEGEAEDDV